MKHAGFAMVEEGESGHHKHTFISTHSSCGGRDGGTPRHCMHSHTTKDYIYRIDKYFLNQTRKRTTETAEISEATVKTI